MTTSRIYCNGNSIDLNIWSISTLDTVEFEDFEENNRILLRKLNFPLMIPNPSLEYSYVVLNLWPNLSFVVLIKLLLAYKEKRVVRDIVRWFGKIPEVNDK